MTISSVGVGSNLDLSSLLTQLQTAESQPLVALQAKAKSYTSKLSAYGTLQSALGTLQSAAKKLSDPALFQTVTGTPSGAKNHLSGAPCAVSGMARLVTSGAIAISPRIMASTIGAWLGNSAGLSAACLVQ